MPPGRRREAGCAHLQHEIVVVQQRPPLLEGVVGAEQGVRESQQRLGGSRRRRRLQPLGKGADALLLGQQDGQRLGICGARALGGQALFGPRFACLGQEHLGVGAGQACRPRRRIIDPGADDRGPFLVAGRAVIEGAASPRQRCFIEGAVTAGGGQQRLGGIAGRQTEEGPHGLAQGADRAVGGDEVAKPAAVGRQFADDAVDAGLVYQFGQMADRPGQPGVAAVEGADQGGGAGLGQQLGAGPLVDDLEMRRHRRLQRELAEQRFAKSVDGADLEAARRVQYLGKQAPRPHRLRLLGLPSQEICQVVLQGGVRHQRPGTQPFAQPVGHFGGGRLGEGQAEDAPRRRAGQQQPADAVDEDAGLAGAGVGRHPHRAAGVGGGKLGTKRGLGFGRHSSPPPASHSLTRARWS